MADQEPFPQNEEFVKIKKQLRKRENRMLERLEEARVAQADALERYQRAEAQLYKRMASAQRIEGQLAVIRQQVEALRAPSSSVQASLGPIHDLVMRTIVKEEKAIAETTAQKEPVTLSTTEATVQTSADTQESSQQKKKKKHKGEVASPGIEKIGKVKKAVVQDEEDEDLVLEEEEEEDDLAADEQDEEESDVTQPFAAITPVENIAITIEVVTEPVEVAEEIIALADTIAVVEEIAIPQQEAPADIATTQPQDVLTIQEEDEVAASADEAVTVESIMAAVERVVQEQAEEDVLVEEIAAQTVQNSLSAEKAELIRQARAVAEAAEEAAEEAIERAAELALHLEQMVGGRHLEHELQQLQSEADRANALAVEAAQVLQAAEQLILGNVDVNGVHMPASPRVEAFQKQPSSNEAEQITAIEGEEDHVEEIAAMITADVAAIAAAEAEAIAEASSARVREAQDLVHLAERVQEQIHEAIERGVLVGEEADAALREAEREVTHTHAVLADAEATEERALSNAINAEAEAEVAEGMAFAITDISNHDESAHKEQGEATNVPAETAFEDDDVTLKMPRVRPFKSV